MNGPSEAAGSIDCFKYCPHHPDGLIPEFAIECSCRKPKAGMLISILDWFKVEPEQTIFFGDAESDLNAGRLAEIETHIVEPGKITQVVNELVFEHDCR